MNMNLQTAFTRYLLEDHYHIPEDDRAKVAGNLGAAATIATILGAFAVGYSMDLFGRKWITVGGFMVMGIAVFFKAIPDNIGWLYLLRVCTQLGALPMIGSPFAVDYCQQGSIGRMTGFHMFLGAFG